MAPLASLRFDSRKKVFLLAVPGFGRLSFLPRAVVDGEEVPATNWTAGPFENNGQRFRASGPLGTLTLLMRVPAGPGDVLGELSLEVRLRRTAKNVHLLPVVFRGFSADHILTHGRKMGGCGSRLLAGIKEPITLCSDFLFWVTRGASTIQFSHPLSQVDLSGFSMTVTRGRVRELSAGTHFESVRSRHLVSAPVTIAASRKGHDLMLGWAETQAKGFAPVPVPQESGWNSWDYYRWTITEDEVYKNADLIASDPVLARHIKRIIVDDGWQYCYGEWEPNSLFPSGMKKLARNLSRMGFTPGLWFAPTIAEPHSRLAQLHPEMLAAGASGFPCLGFSCMERKGFILDPTHSGVRAWWDELFRRYAGYGYRYFKLDFLAWTVRARRFADPSAGPGELMRHIIQPIRAAVGSRSRILGCNFNLDGGPGLVDDVRVSSDIHSRWKSVKENACAVAARFWAHGRFWINDPDFALCRGEETSEDPNLHQLKAMLPFVRPEDTNPQGVDYLDSLVDLSHAEAEVLLGLVIVSGGAMNLSDNLPRLNEAGLRLLRKSVQAEKGAAAVPVDLFRSELPAFWVQKLASGLHRVLLINWTDRAALREMDLAGLNVPTAGLVNFWTGESVPVKAGRVSAHLAPHSCLLLESKSRRSA